MAKRPGRIVQYIKKDGNTQKAIAYNDRQSVQLRGRLHLVLVNDDMTEKKIDGKTVIGAQHASLCKLIGYVD